MRVGGFIITKEIFANIFRKMNDFIDSDKFEIYVAEKFIDEIMKIEIKIKIKAKAHPTIPTEASIAQIIPYIKYFIEPLAKLLEPIDKANPPSITLASEQVEQLDLTE